MAILEASEDILGYHGDEAAHAREQSAVQSPVLVNRGKSGIDSDGADEGKTRMVRR